MGTYGASEAPSAGDSQHEVAELKARLRRAETLVRIASEVRFDRPLAEVLEVLAERITEHTRAIASAVVLLKATDLSPVAQGGWNLPGEYLEGMAAVRQGPEYSAEFHEVLASGRTHVLRDAREHFATEPGYAWVRPMLDELKFRTMVAVPFVSRPGTYGVVYIYYGDDSEVDEEEVAFARAIAERAAPVMDNALLFAETQRRTAELEALFQADEALRRSLHLDDVIEAMADLAIELLGADTSLVATWDSANELGVKTTRGFHPDTRAVVDRIYRGFLREHFANLPQPIPTAMVDDVSRTPVLVERLGPKAAGALAEVPVIIEGEFWGMFSIGWRQPQSFSDADRRLFDAFAARAALAIHNAILFEQAQTAASNEERQRLARDLHDSVSQALYGIGLGARTARKRMGDSRPELAEPIDYIVQLAESGLAETRALIFELVPESLAEQGLVLALQRQGALTQARHALPVTMEFCEEPNLPVRTKEALYRIAQESLNNIAKHAAATVVELRLAAADGMVTLTIRDDGRGFNTGGEFPGHFGLRSMAERGSRIGGTYEITSAPGAGTMVRVVVPAAV